MAIKKVSGSKFQVQGLYSLAKALRRKELKLKLKLTF